MAKHGMSISPESRSLAGLSYWDDTQKVPEGGAVPAVVEYGDLDFLVGLELVAEGVYRRLVGVSPGRAGADVRVGWQDPRACGLQHGSRRGRGGGINRLGGGRGIRGRRIRYGRRRGSRLCLGRRSVLRRFMIRACDWGDMFVGLVIERTGRVGYQYLSSRRLHEPQIAAPNVLDVVSGHLIERLGGPYQGTVGQVEINDDTRGGMV